MDIQLIKFGGHVGDVRVKSDMREEPVDTVMVSDCVTWHLGFTLQLHHHITPRLSVLSLTPRLLSYP